MKSPYLICLLSSIAITTFSMDPTDQDLSDSMLSSFVIIDQCGQTLACKHPMMQDLQTLCRAANECTHSIHLQLERLFRNCRIPLSPYQKSDFTLLKDLSPIDKLLKTLQLLDPQDDTSTAVIADYEPDTTSVSDFQNNTTPAQKKIVQENTEKSQAPVTSEHTKAGSYSFLKAAISYPLAPFVNVIAFMRNHSQSTVQDITEQKTAHPVVVEPDPTVENHEKYCKVVMRGKRLLDQVTCHDKETKALLEQLKEQLVILQKGIMTNIETIELDRSSFANLQQCILEQGMTLSDMLLLQYSKIRQGAAIDTALQEFFGREDRKLSDITQEEFDMQWKAIQEKNQRGELSPAEFSKLRQYSYILQNPTARFIAQTFIDGTVNNYGMAPKVAQEQGLTQEHIGELNAELSNCKDFLMQLNRAFTESVKNIEKAMQTSQTF